MQVKGLIHVKKCTLSCSISDCIEMKNKLPQVNRVALTKFVLPRQIPTKPKKGSRRPEALTKTAIPASLSQGSVALASVTEAECKFLF